MDEIWLAYVGTLGHSYDLTCTIDALKILQEKGINNIKFVVMGDGPLKSKFENYAKNKGTYAEFTGRLNYGKMVGILTSCDIAANPISKGAAASIINKHADYAAAGLPVLNTQECLEYRNLITEYNAGFNCENGNSVDLADKLLKLCKNESLRNIMGKNSRKLAEEKFDRSVTYQEVLSIIKNK
ncbi:MAG: glycosyltransferase [Bacillota bacterium]